jgi:hypothetical protein
MSDRMTRRGYRTPAARSPQQTGFNSGRRTLQGERPILHHYEKSRSRSHRDNNVAAPRNGEVLCADLANVMAPE